MRPERLDIDCIDLAMDADSKYNSEYWGKVVCNTTTNTYHYFYQNGQGYDILGFELAMILLSLPSMGSALTPILTSTPEKPATLVDLIGGTPTHISVDFDR